MIEIRPYTPDDYEAVAANLRAADMFDETWDTRENVDGLEASVDPRNFILLADDGDEVVGNIFSTAFGPRVAFFWRLAVMEHRRREGIAHRLITATQHRLQAMGVVEVCALVDSHKTELLDFYEKQGFHYSDYNWKVIWKPTTESN